jgi:hypothetical protein
MNLYKEEENQSPHESVPGTGQPQSISGWFIAIPLVVFVIMAAGIIIGGGWLGAIRPADSRLVYQAVGEGTMTCPDSFSVTDEWELRWEHHGELQEICWTNQIGVEECYTAMHRKPIRQHGSVNVGHGGTYTLRVTGTGAWKLQVYRLGEAR